MLKQIMTLVQAQGHLVLATCAAGGQGCRPHASLMAYCASADGLEFWLATLADTRKYANLQANPLASLLVGDVPGDLALTVEAGLMPFADAGAEDAARRALLARHPGLAGFLGLEGVAMLRLVGLRYQLLSGPTEVFVWSPEKSLDGAGRKT